MEGQNELQSFITTSCVGIPQDTLQRALDHYQQKDQWWTSSKAYDEWFHTHYTQYDDFIKAAKKEALEDEIVKLDFPEKSLKPKGRGRKRAEYRITFRVLCQLEMRRSKEARVYYKTIEDAIFTYNQRRFNELSENLQLMSDQIKIKDAIIDSLAVIKKASLYRIKDRRDGRLLYIGQDKSILQNRPQQHLSVRSQILQQRKQQIDIALVLLPSTDIIIEVVPCSYNDVDALEQQAIREEKPYYNQSYAVVELLQCDECGKEYKLKGAFENHMLKHQQ